MSVNEETNSDNISDTQSDIIGTDSEQKVNDIEVEIEKMKTLYEGQ